jgi:hypothetical protein
LRSGVKAEVAGRRLFVVKSVHAPTVSKLAFILNWFEELKATVPSTK